MPGAVYIPAKYFNPELDVVSDCYMEDFFSPKGLSPTKVNWRSNIPIQSVAIEVQSACRFDVKIDPVHKETDP
jgi:hypothetical protein